MSSHETQVSILGVLLDGPVLQRDLSKKAGINKGVVSREIGTSLKNLVEVKRGVPLGDHIKKYKGKKFFGNIIALKEGLSTYREIWHRYESLQKDLRRSPHVVEALMKEYMRAYPISEKCTQLLQQYLVGLSVSHSFFQWHIETEPSVLRGRLEKWYATSNEGVYIHEAEPFTKSYPALIQGIYATKVSKDGFPVEGIARAPVSINSLIAKALFVDFLTGKLEKGGEDFLDKHWKKQAEIIIESKKRAGLIPSDMTIKDIDNRQES